MGGNKSFSGLLLLSFSLISSTLSLGTTPAPPCDHSACLLPDCRCSEFGTPRGFERAETPQFVFLSFDDAINDQNYQFYVGLLTGRKNPNNESITATFFVSHDYTVYPNLHQLWRNGHEIALHSISGNYSQEYWRSLNASMWRQELIDQRDQLYTFARIPVRDIKGARAPQLQIGDGDAMYSVLKQANIVYDASRPTRARRNGLWPYTNDFKSTQDCQIETCPIGQYEGLWTVPMIIWEHPLNGNECSMADQCDPPPTTRNSTFELLKTNFLANYNEHRAPFGIFTRHGFVNGTGNDFEATWERRLGYMQFLDYLHSLNDVYIVSISRAVEWMKNPTPLSSVANFPDFKVDVKPDQCPRKNSCFYRAGQTPFKPPFSQERLFHTCSQCPVAYPWVGNHLGRDQYSD